MVGGRVLACAGGFVLAACAGVASRGAATGAAPAEGIEARARREIEALAERVAVARGLPQTRPTPVEVHDEDSFQRALGVAAQHTGLPPTVVDSPGFQLAFGLAVLARESTPPFGVTQRQQTVAFYDPVEHRIHARRSGFGVEDRESRDLVLAHELGHSLQYQHFRLPEYRSMTAEDERVSQIALLEGDAMLTMLAYASSRSHVPLSRALVRARDEAARSLAQYQDASGVARKSDGMPAVHRARLMFTYYSGLNFVGELYRAGGYELVNRVYERPPITTEHVLHPDRYLAGEQPLEVAAPPAPRGYTSLGEGRVGELWTRLTLAVCLREEQAFAASAGWGGDAYRVLGTPDGLGALVWHTAWDSPADAEQFEEAARGLAKCWEREQLRAGSLFVGPPLVRRAKARVVLVRGMPPALAREQAQRALATRVEPKRDDPPHGSVVLRSPRRAAPLPEPRAQAGVLSVPKLGFRAALPPGFAVEFGDVVSLRKGEPRTVQIILGTEEIQLDEGSLRLLHAKFVESFSAEIQTEIEPDGPSRALETAFGRGILRRWRLSDGEGAIGLLAIPVCGNTGTLLAMTFANDAGAEAEIAAWLRTLAPWPGNDAGICAKLDP